MRRNQRKRPFYRRPWLWLVVAVLLISGGLFISNRHQTTEVQDDTAVKTTSKADKQKSSKKAQKKAHRKSAKTASPSQPAAQSSNRNISAQADSQGQTTTSQTTTGNGQESWVDPDNYEPNSIVGDKSTMKCYLPGQTPSPAIAPENLVYFDSLTQARAEGYQTVE